MDAIQGVKDITSENPVKQIWKFLRSFIDFQYVAEEISRIQDVPKNKNVVKQARQIGYCIRQAEEYFQASAQVGLPTRPLLLYYGAVSLSRALILLKRDGDHSFDRLYKTKKHHHHGLNLVGDVYATEGNKAVDFFSTLECQLHTNNNEPWGNFPLFYRTLIPDAFFLQSQRKRQRANAGRDSFFLELKEHLLCPTLPEIETFISMRFNSLELLKSLPDMFYTLTEMNIRPYLCRGNVKSESVLHYDDTAEEKGEQLVRIQYVYDFFMNGILETNKIDLVNLYAQHNPLIKVQADLGSNVHLHLELENILELVEPYFLPDMVDDINGEKFFILYPDQYTSESATFFVILFCLGMLSRYNPDVWMKAIDMNVQIAELTDSFLNLAYRKFPNLILNQMTSTKHFVHL
jgi:hypothetical protein